MKYRLTKTSHTHHTLDGTLLESKSYLPHDLMHFAYANIAHSKEGYFSQSTDTKREEVLVGVLQGAYKDYTLIGDGLDVVEFRERVNQYLSTLQLPLVDWDRDLLLSIFKEYEYFSKRWREMRTGESIEIVVSI